MALKDDVHGVLVADQIWSLGNGGRLTGASQYDGMVFNAVTSLDSRLRFTTTRDKTLRFQDYAEVRVRATRVEPCERPDWTKLT